MNSYIIHLEFCSSIHFLSQLGNYERKIQLKNLFEKMCNFTSLANVEADMQLKTCAVTKTQFEELIFSRLL